MVKMSKKARVKKTNTKKVSTNRPRKSSQNWWQQRRGLLFVVGFAIVASLLVVSSLAKTPAVKDLEVRQRSELRALKARHEAAEDTKDDQCDAMSGDQEDVCEDELKVLKDQNEIEEDSMKAAHKAAMKTLKASEAEAGSNGNTNQGGSGTGGQGSTSGGGQGQQGQNGTNGGAGGAGGSGSCTGNCSGGAGNNGTGTNGQNGTSNPGTSSPGTPGSPGGSTSSSAPRFSILTAGQGNRCVDVPGQNTANGIYIQLWDCNSTSAQLWIGEGTNNNNGVFHSAINYNKCLDVDAAFGGRNGSPVELYDCHGGPNQRWSSHADGSLRSLASGRCLDVTNWGTLNGAKLQIWDCHQPAPGSNQRWTYRVFR